MQSGTGYMNKLSAGISAACKTCRQGHEKSKMKATTKVPIINSPNALATV